MLSCEGRCSGSATEVYLDCDVFCINTLREIVDIFVVINWLCNLTELAFVVFSAVVVHIGVNSYRIICIAVLR